MTFGISRPSGTKGKIAPVEAMESADVRALGGAVGIHYLGVAGGVFQPSPDARDRDGLAAKDGKAQGSEVGETACCRGIDQWIEGTRGAVDHRYPVLTHQLYDTGDVVGAAIVKLQAPAGKQGRKQILLCKVKAWRTDNQGGVGGSKAHFSGIPLQQVGEAFSMD